MARALQKSGPRVSVAAGHPAAAKDICHLAWQPSRRGAVSVDGKSQSVGPSCRWALGFFCTGAVCPHPGQTEAQPDWKSLLSQSGNAQPSPLATRNPQAGLAGPGARDALRRNGS